ncbi:transporter [Citrobacter freundii]|uniref:colistin resistant protein CrrC n=1 Tax=Citrobacter TaxID=544 RepID=UPI0015E9CFC6|nr:MULTISPECIES: transporter [Citrobacter]QLR93452.1 transporter [Citrobacter freundii]QLS41234.1 transporter [Citrobacter freundii]HEE0043796.1 transporter [Citrobacter freundii]HEE9926987.1 transporter [Citrobacter freundii]
MMLTKFLFRRENLMASLLFCIVTYGLLSTWLRLVHAINEKVESTLPSSLLIRVFIIIAALSFFLQKKPGVLKSFIAITFGLILLFLQAITVLHLLLNSSPDINDFVFYYESFLLVFLCGVPLFLCLRMV